MFERLGLVKRSTLKAAVDSSQSIIDDLDTAIRRKNELIDGLNTGIHKVRAELNEMVEQGQDFKRDIEDLSVKYRDKAAKLEQYHKGAMYTLARLNVECTFYEDRSFVGNNSKTRVTFEPDLYDCRDKGTIRHRYGSHDQHGFNPTEQELNVLKRIFSEVGIQYWHWGNDNRPAAYFSSHDILEIAGEVSSCNNTLQAHLDNVLTVERDMSIASELQKLSPLAPEKKEPKTGQGQGKGK